MQPAVLRRLQQAVSSLASAHDGVLPPGPASTLDCAYDSSGSAVRCSAGCIMMQHCRSPLPVLKLTRRLELAAVCHQQELPPCCLIQPAHCNGLTTEPAALRAEHSSRQRCLQE